MQTAVQVSGKLGQHGGRRASSTRRRCSGSSPTSMGGTARVAGTSEITLKPSTGGCTRPPVMA